MNYCRIYDQLMQGKHHRKKGNVYYELHHIIPKTLGGTNAKSNLVLLTAKEHYVAHKLLIKMHPESIGLKVGLFRLTHASSNLKQEKKFNSRQYAYAKQVMSEAAKMRRGPLNPFYGKIHNERTRELMSVAGKRKIGELNPNYGNRWTDEQKARISALNRGQRVGDLNPSKSLEARRKASNAKLGHLNPNAQVWNLRNVKTGETLKLYGGIRRFLKDYPGSTYFKCRTGTDPNWLLAQS